MVLIYKADSLELLIVPMRNNSKTVLICYNVTSGYRSILREAQRNGNIVKLLTLFVLPPVPKRGNR